MTYSQSIRGSLAMWVGISSVLVFSAQVRADNESQNDYNRRYRSNYEVPKGDLYTGRSPYMKAAGPAAIPAAPLAPRAAVKQSCSEANTGLVRLTKRMPPQVVLGQEFMYELEPTAVACVANVVVTDHVPKGASYVRSEPAAETQGEHLVWRINALDPDESRNIKVWLKPEQEGPISSCAMISADPRACAGTIVGKPMLAITKTGAETAQVGSDVTYNITVSNPGSAAVHGIVVTDPVPEGFSHSSGQKELSFTVGDLNPNQSKSFPVVLRANQRGKFCNTAVAASTDAAKTSAEACTTVVQAGVKIVKSTKDKQLLINRSAMFSIAVSNTGDVPLTGVVVTDTAAPGLTILTADGATVNGNVATWNVGDLAAGAEKSVSVTVTSRSPGQLCNSASVATAEGLRDTSYDCSEWKGVSGVLVELVDDPDPIQVGETTTFTIRVTNQGTSRDIEDVNVKSIFKEEMDPVRASNGATVAGKTVVWPALARLAPKQTLTYTIVGKALKAGDHRIETQVTTRDRETPIVQLESTTVY